jgi:ankyrin repeat protein
MPLPNDFQKTAITTAYLNFYGKFYSNDSTAIVYRASNRYYHGIMHAIGCMELILPVHNLYKKHVSRYEESLGLIGNAFGLSIEELITLVQITALFHDSGRQDEGDDYWDAESGENLYQFLIQNRVNADLALILKQTIAYKDNADEFGQNTVQWGLANLDYLRQLVNSADTLEVIRVRDIFYCRYLPIMDISAEQLLQPQQLVVDIEHLVTTAAQRIYYEWRGLPYPYVERKDGTRFAIHYEGIHRMHSMDHAFAQYCKNHALDLPRPESSEFITLDKSRLNLIEAETAAIKIQRAYGVSRSFKTTERQAEVNPSKVSSRNLALLRHALREHVGFSDINPSTLNDMGLTEEESLVYQYLLRDFPWTLKHRTSHLASIQGSGNVLRSLEERNRKGAYNTNSHTNSLESRSDNVFFTIGSPANPPPLFLERHKGYSVDIPIRPYLSKNQTPRGPLTGLWLGSTWWRYLYNTAHKNHIGKALRTVRYSKDNKSKFLNPNDFIEYTYTLDGKELKRALNFGEESVAGKEFLPFLAMTLILELRFTAPEFRKDCLENMTSPGFDAFVDMIFCDKNFEALIPKSFNLNDPNIVIHSFGQMLEDNHKNILRMREAISSNSIKAVQSLLDQGVSIEINLGGNQTPLLFAIISNSRDIALFLIKKGASSIFFTSSPILNVAVSKSDYDVVRAILTTPRPDSRSKLISYYHHIGEDTITVAINDSGFLMLDFLLNLGIDFKTISCGVLTGILNHPTSSAINILQYLKTHGFNFSSTTEKDSITLYDLLSTCLEQQKSELFEAFLLCGVNPNLSVEGKPSLLDLSIYQNANIFTDLLIFHGAKPSLKNIKNNPRDAFYVHLLVESHAGDLLLVKKRYHDGSLSIRPRSLCFQTHLISNDVIAQDIFRAIGVSAKFNIQWQESDFNGDVVIKLNFLQEVLPRETDHYGKTTWLSKASSQSENHDSFTTHWLESASKEGFLALLENRNQLITAIEQDDVDLANEIIKKGVYDPQGKALLSACDKPSPNLKLIEFLLSNGYDIKASKHPLLHYAIVHDNKRLLIFLINHGANVNLQCGPAKHTPLMYAAICNNIELMAVLENHGASYKHPHNQWILAAACASYITDKTFDYLLTKANLNADFRGITPLLICSENQDAYRVEALLQRGVDTEIIHPVEKKTAENLFKDNVLFAKYAPPKTSPPGSWAEFAKHPITYLKLAQHDRIDDELLSREYGFVTQDMNDHLVNTFLGSYDIKCFKPFKLVITTEGNTPVFTCPGFTSTVIAIHKDFLVNRKAGIRHVGFALLHELIKNEHYTSFQYPQKKEVMAYDWQAVQYTGFDAGIDYCRMADEFYQAHYSLENFQWPKTVYVNRPWDESPNYDARIKALKLKHAESQIIHHSPQSFTPCFELLPEIEYLFSYQYVTDFDKDISIEKKVNYFKQQLPRLCDEFLPFQLTNQPSQALKQFCRLLMSSGLEEVMLDELLIAAEEIKLPGFSYLYKSLAGLPGLAHPCHGFSEEQRQEFKFLGYFKGMRDAMLVFMQAQNPESIHHAATQMMMHYVKIRHHFREPENDHTKALASYVKNNHTLPNESLENYTHLGPIFLWPQYVSTAEYRAHLEAAKHFSDEAIWQALWVMGEWQNDALYNIIPVEFLKTFILPTSDDDTDGLMPLREQWGAYRHVQKQIRQYLAKTTSVIFFEEHPNSCEELLCYIKQNAAHLYDPSLDKGKQATSILLESFSLFINGNDDQKNVVLDYFTRGIDCQAYRIEQLTPFYYDFDQYADFIIAHIDFFTPNTLRQMLAQCLNDSPQKWPLLFRSLGLAQWETNYSQWVALIEFFSAEFFHYPILSLLTNSYWHHTHEFSSLDKQTVKLMELLPGLIADNLLNNKLKFPPVNQCQLDLDKSIILYRYLDSRFIFPNEAYEQQLADYIIDNIKKISDPSVQLALLIRLMDADDGIYINNITFTAKLISVYCQILSHVLGQDDGSLHYYISAQPYLSHINKHCQHQDAVKLFAKIADTILAQKHVSNLMGNLLEPKRSEQFTQQFAPIYTSMCQLVSILGKEKDDKFKTIHFISSPLSAASLEAFALFICRHPKFGDLMEELKLRQHTGRTIEVIKNSLTIFYQQFWNVDIQMRAILLDHLMITAQEDSRQETQIKAYQLGFDYMVGKLFPDAAENSRTHFALALLSSYLKTAHPSEQQFLLAAILVVTKESQNNASLGKKFALLCEHMGPAYIKLAQAIHSHPDTPADIKADLSHVKGHANPPYRWHLWRLATQVLPRDLFERIKSLGKLLGSASYNLAIECKTEQNEALVLTLLREGAEAEAIKGFAHLKRTLDDCQHPLFLQNKDTFIRMIEEADLMSKNELDHNIGLKQHLLAAKKYKTTITLPSSEPGSPLYSVHFQACQLYECGPGYKLLSEMPGVEFNALPEDEGILKNVVAKAVIGKELSLLLSGMAFDCDRHGNQLRVKVVGQNIYLGLFDFGEMGLAPLTETELRSTAELLRELPHQLAKKGTGIDNLFQKHIKTAISKGESYRHLMRFNKALLALQDFREHVTAKEFKNIIVKIQVTAHPLFKEALDSYWQTLHWWDKSIAVGTAIIESACFFKKAPPQEEFKEDADEPLVFEPTKQAPG